jgi:hypothetical protein
VEEGKEERRGESEGMENMYVLLVLTKDPVILKETKDSFHLVATGAQVASVMPWYVC